MPAGPEGGMLAWTRHNNTSACENLIRGPAAASKEIALSTRAGLNKAVAQATASF
jgi:hypothetical protein